MQFSIKTPFLALAVFLPLASAAALVDGKRQECQPLLQSCSVDSECCANLCVAGVSISAAILATAFYIDFMNQLCA